MKLIVLFGVSCLLGLRFRTHSSRVLIVILGIFVLIPTSATALLTGRDYGVSGPLSLLPMTIVVCAVAAVVICFFPMVMLRLRFPVPQTIAIVLVLASAMVETLARGGGSGMGQLLDTLVGPIILFLLIVASHRIDPRMGQSLRVFLITLGAFEAVLGIAQYILKRPIFFEGEYARQAWFQYFNVTAFRSMGTFDHPLNYALFLLLGLCLTLSLSNRVLSAILTIVFIVAIAASASRSALLGAVYVMLMMTVTRRSSTRWVVFWVGLVAGSLLVFSILGDVLASRLSDDAGSAATRRQAANLFVHILPRHVLLGSGLGSSQQASILGGLRTSFESPFFSLTIEIGLVMTVLLFSAMVSLAVSRGVSRAWSPENVGALTVLAVTMTYSSFGVKSAAGYLVWIALSLPQTLPSYVESLSRRSPCHVTESGGRQIGVESERANRGSSGESDPSHLPG